MAYRTNFEPMPRFQRNIFCCEGYLPALVSVLFEGVTFTILFSQVYAKVEITMIYVYTTQSPFYMYGLVKG